MNINKNNYFLYIMRANFKNDVMEGTIFDIIGDKTQKEFVFTTIGWFERKWV